MLHSYSERIGQKEKNKLLPTFQRRNNISSFIQWDMTKVTVYVNPLSRRQAIFRSKTKTMRLFSSSSRSILFGALLKPMDWFLVFTKVIDLDVLNQNQIYLEWSPKIKKIECVVKTSSEVDISSIIIVIWLKGMYANWWNLYIGFFSFVHYFCTSNIILVAM